METGVSYAKLDPDHDERFLSLRRELGVTSFGINQILLKPGQRGRIHLHHEQEEVFIVLSGTLTLTVEGEPRELGQGEHVGRDGEAFERWDQETGAPPQEVPLPEDEPV